MTTKTMYAVSSGSYSDYQVHCVCTTKEKAEALANLFYDGEVEEFSIDPEVPTFDVPLFKAAVNLETGAAAADEEDYRPSSLSCGMDKYTGAPVVWLRQGRSEFGWLGTLMTTYVRAESAEAAIKVASERRRAILALPSLPEVKSPLHVRKIRL